MLAAMTRWTPIFNLRPTANAMLLNVQLQHRLHALGQLVGRRNVLNVVHDLPDRWLAHRSHPAHAPVPAEVGWNEVSTVHVSLA